MRKPKPIASTLDDIKSYSTRRCGNTTRQIDKAIQLLYSENIVKVRDHWNNGKHRRANENLFVRILDRLNLEHNLKKLLQYKQIRIDKQKLELELLYQLIKV